MSQYNYNNGFAEESMNNLEAIKKLFMTDAILKHCGEKSLGMFFTNLN